jgi:cytochrome c553
MRRHALKVALSIGAHSALQYPEGLFVKTSKIFAGTLFAVLLGRGVAPVALAVDGPQQQLERWRAETSQPFSAARGRALFTSKSGSDWSCATCHTADPRQAGRHATTARPIAPLAPAANPQRFTDAAKVEKWFRRNCRDVLNRECTATEKGDVLSWLIELR